VKACFLGWFVCRAKHFAAASFTSTSLLQEELGVSQAAYLTAAVVSISALIDFRSKWYVCSHVWSVNIGVAWKLARGTRR